MTDSLPKEIVPSEGELKAARFLHTLCNFSSCNTYPYQAKDHIEAMAERIALDTRADGLTALQQKERAEKAEEEIKELEEDLLCHARRIGQLNTENERLEQSLSAAEASLKLADEMHFESGGLDMSLELRLRAARKAYKLSRQSPQPTPAGEEEKR